MGIAASGISTWNNLFSLVPGFNSKPKETQDSSTFLGHSYKVFSENFGAWTDVVNYTETFHSTVKFFTCFAATIEPAIFLRKFSVTFLDVEQFIDGLRFIASAKNVLELEFWTEAVAGRIASSASTIAFLIADFGSAMSLIGYMGLVDLGKVFLFIGSISLFGMTLPAVAGAVVIGTYSLHFQTTAFLLLGIQSFNDLSDAKENDKNTLRNQLWLATCVSEVVHKSFILGCTAALSTPIGLMTAGFLGMIANGLGIASAYIELKGVPKGVKHNP